MGLVLEGPTAADRHCCLLIDDLCGDAGARDVLPSLEMNVPFDSNPNRNGSAIAIDTANGEECYRLLGIS